MATRLPSNPNLKQLRNQAKDILNAHARRDPSCCQVLGHLRQFRGKSNEQILGVRIRLSQVQFALAMEYGFEAWTDLTRAVRTKRTGAVSGLVDHASLANTLDAVSETLFEGVSIPARERAEVARFVAARQGQPGAYACMFAPVGEELAGGLRLFTGERITSSAGARHILGEEACRVLHLLGVRDAGVRAALDEASAGILKRLDDVSKAQTRGGDAWRKTGMYCCGKCSLALWRHLAARGDDYAEEKLALGIRGLRRRRAGDGRWKGLPFDYTLLTLLEADPLLARPEMRYAATVCEAGLRKRTNGTNVHAQRRRRIAERVLAQC